MSTWDTPRARFGRPRLGCRTEAGFIVDGVARTVVQGAEIATGDHIIPRSVVAELDNRIYNLEFMPETLNNRKGNKVTDRQVQLARKWNAVGLLSDAGLKAVEAAR